MPPDASSLRAYVARTAAGQSVTAWHRVPVARRAAVLVLLFVGRAGEWRVVLTRRLARLRLFPGHVLLPGGKADLGLELAWHVAQREAREEIGLRPAPELARAYGAHYHPVAELPCYLLRTLLAVRPCVAVLHAPPDAASLGLALNPGETLAIFLVPLRDFMPPARARAEPDCARAEPDRALEAVLRLHRAARWGGVPWHWRLVTFARDNPHEAPWLRGLDDPDLASDGDSDDDWGTRGLRRNSAGVRIYDVWGLTANILHDVARVVELGLVEPGPAGRVEPGPAGRVEPGPAGSADSAGDEELIYALWRHGHMRAERLAAERRLMGADGAFGELLPRAEVARLRRLYRAPKRAPNRG